MGKGWVFCGLASALVLAAVSASGQSAGGKETVVRLDERQIRAAGIETTSVEPEAGVSELVVPGTVAVPPQQLRLVAAPAAGLIESFLVAPDEDVAQGAPIAQLHSSELLEAQRAFLAAHAEEALAAEKLRRDEQLYRERIIAERRLLVTRAEASLALSRLDERQQLLALQGMSDQEIARLRSDRKIASSLTVRAPMAGTILQRHGTPGERVSAAAPLVTIARLSPIWINLQVPVARAAALSTDGRVALPSLGLEGKIVRIGRTVDSATQSVTAVAEVEPRGATVRPGQIVQAVVRLPGGQQQWRVPAAAVAHHEGREYIFLRTPDGFRATPVQVLAETPDHAFVRADAHKGDQVVSRGLLAVLGQMSAGK